MGIPVKIENATMDAQIYHGFFNKDASHQLEWKLEHTLISHAKSDPYSAVLQVPIKLVQSFLSWNPGGTAVIFEGWLK